MTAVSSGNLRSGNTRLRAVIALEQKSRKGASSRATLLSMFSGEGGIDRLKSRFYSVFKQSKVGYGADFLRISVKRSLGLERIPPPRRTIYIETSSICNLACKFCAYSKKTSPKIVMSNQFFERIINEATDLGFTHFGLTPITGDIFFDKTILQKLEFLDDHPRVKGYTFYTNFILPEQFVIFKLFEMKKLFRLTASLYGHDGDSFKKITESNDAAYERLKSNLRTVASIGPNVNRVHFSLAWRTYDSFNGSRPVSDLVEIVSRLQNQYGLKIQINKLYDNWGGYITRDDLTGLDMNLLAEKHVYKNGACSYIFAKNQIMANGVVNACACRDVDATLALGDLNNQSLAEILSYKNSIYRNLIERQQKGNFNSICNSCTFYHSIYKRKRGISLNRFFQGIGMPPP